MYPATAQLTFLPPMIIPLHKMITWVLNDSALITLMACWIQADSWAYIARAATDTLRKPSSLTLMTHVVSPLNANLQGF